MKIDKKQSPKNCALLAPFFALALANSAFAQQVRPETPTTQPTPTPVASEQVPDDEELLVLSPFTVTTTKDQGYFAANTLAGSRMNTNIADLGAAISVVTKQQMEDTGSLDINDVFRYEIGTEGSSTYTPAAATFRGDGVADANAGASFGNSTGVSTNATANRVRGLGAPSPALNYYPAIAAVPFDSYNTQSIEISRGPNSMLFGMGSPAGIVNQSTAQAILNRNTASVSVRVDDRESKRGSFNFNRVLVRDKLAIYGAFLYNDQQFERKPSYDITRRQYGAITYKPFRGTKITASVEGYSNDNRRPNSLTPIDTVSEWRKANMPVYNPVTKRITWLSSGQVSPVQYLPSPRHPDANAVISYVQNLPGYNPALFRDVTASGTRTVTYNGVSLFGAAALQDRNSVLYIPGITTQNQSRTIQRVSNGQMQNWFQPLGEQNYVTSWGANSAGSTNFFSNVSNPATTTFPYSNPVWADYFSRYTTNSTGWSGPNSTTQMKNFRYPGVSDKSIYDWESINVNQTNFGNQENANYNVEIEQELIPRLLNMSAGWLRQDFDSMQSYTISQLQASTLFVDTNVLMPDGSQNPYLGQVYVEDFDPDRFRTSKVVDNARAMVAFTPDFTAKSGWQKWLGRHQILGLASYLDDMTTSFRDRLQFVDGSATGRLRYMRNPLNNAQGQPTGWNMQNNSIHRQYYLSNPGDPYGAVSRSSGSWDNSRAAGAVNVYNYNTQSFENVDVVTDWNVHDGGTGRTQRKLNSYSAGWTGYLFQDRLISTLGIRKDINRTRGTTNGATATAPSMTNAERWVNGQYQYDAIFNRWSNWSRVMGTTSTIGAVAKPFTNWAPISRRAQGGNVLWEFVENFGLSYNKSDNFDAPTTTNVDFFRKRLPKPVGDGKDIGVQFSILENKLFARVNWFESTNENMIAGGNAGNAIQRLSGHADTTAFRGWLEHLYVINQGYDPTQANWRQAFDANAANVPAMQAQVGEWWGQAYDYYANMGGTVGGTMTAKAEGVEVQVNYNPLPNWTIKFTATKVETINDSVLQEFDAWRKVRQAAWDAADSADFLLPQYQALYGTPTGYTDSSGRQVIVNNFWKTSTNYNSEIRSDSVFGWTTPENYYNATAGPQYTLAKDLEGQQVPGQRKYNWSVLTNYNFDHGSLKGFSVGGAQRWADKAVIGYYGRATGADAANPGVIDVSDVNRPIYDDATWYTDLWVGYTKRIFADKVRMKLQLNVTDVFQDGELMPVAVNYDGSVSAYRIIDPRQFILTASFDF